MEALRVLVCELHADDAATTLAETSFSALPLAIENRVFSLHAGHGGFRFHHHPSGILARPAPWNQEHLLFSRSAEPSEALAVAVDCMLALPGAENQKRFLPISSGQRQRWAWLILPSGDTTAL